MTNHPLRVCSYLQEIGEWSRTNLLKLNDHKTDVIVFGTKQKLPTLKDFRITVGDTTRIPSSKVRHLGVVFDPSISMTSHISTICRTAYMHLHNISHIRRYLTIDATKALVHAFVTSRLDYWNALLIGLPRDQINKLQRIQNMAARVITFTPRRDHNIITPVLKDLHWLPVKCRIEYKIPLHVYRCLNGTAPPAVHVSRWTLFVTLTQCRHFVIKLPRRRNQPPGYPIIIFILS